MSIANIGTFSLVKQYLPGTSLYGDYSLNTYNSVAIEFYHRQGLSCVTLSPELNLTQVEQLTGIDDVEVECLVHGHLEMMISEYCVTGSYLGNLTEGCSKPCVMGQYFLKDRKDISFPVVTDQFCRMHILNAKELSMLPHVNTLNKIGVNRLRIEGKYTSKESLYKITKLYRELLDLGENHPLLQNGDFSSVEGREITRGHYFRGVL
jgi:putative protease